MGAAGVGRPVDCTRVLVGRQCRRTYRGVRFLLSSVLTFTTDSEEKGMAARAKKSRGKSGRKTGAKRGASKRRGSSAARKSGRATKRGPAVKRRRSTKSAAKKKRPAVKKRSASAKRSQSRSAAAAPKRARKSPI